MDAQTFWDALKGRGLNFFAGVPDSTFQNAYNVLVNDAETRHVSAVWEDVALGSTSLNRLPQGSDLSRDRRFRAVMLGREVVTS